MAADMAEAPLAIGDFEDGILVSFMNALSLPTLAELEAKGLFPAAGIRLYQYATVDRFSSLPLRTTEIGVFSVDEIKRATLELWRDYGTGRQIDVYLVVPQPDEHVLSGLTFVIDIFHFDYPLAARSLVLLELTSWTLDDSGPGATTSLVLRAGMLPTRARPVDWNREVGLPDGSVVIARGRPLPTWSPAEISMGDLITFLADAPRSQLDSPLVYEIQPDFEEVIRRALRATPPMQGVTVVLHGFWEGRAIRRRAFSTWRPVLEDVRQLAQSIAESFTDLAPRPFHLVAARVPEQFFREDGSLEVVVFVIFDRPSSARPVLLRQLEGGYLVRDILLLVEHQTSISSMLQQAEWAASDIEASWFHAAQPQPWVDIMEVLVPAHGDVFDVVLGLLSDDAADEAPSLLQFDARLFSSFSLVEDFKAAAPIDSAPALQPLSLEELLPQLGKREGISFEDVSCFCSELYTMPAVMEFRTMVGLRYGQMGAAVVAYVRTGSGWFFGGFIAFHPPPQHDFASSYLAELFALVGAYKWAQDLLRHQWKLHGALPLVSVGFDSTSAGYGATGHFEIRHATLLRDALRGLHHWILSEFGIYVEGFHVAAHTGEPGNESANSLAFAAAGGEVDTGFALILDKFWRQRLKVSTINILTGDPAGEERSVGMLCNPRLEGLLRQADEAGALLLGLQETRLRWSGTRTLGHHFIIQTASTQGHFGVALGISLKTCYGLASGVELFFKPADFSVIAEEPRLLLVKVDASHLRCLILVAHTPHSGHSDAELADWWRHLRTVIPAKYKSWDLLCLGDWNARLGSVMSQHVGSAGADVESVNGGWLHQFMADRSLWAPSTFEEVHSGLHGTWQHPRTLAWSRLDFVVLPSAWHCTASYVDDTYDAALGHLDHSAVSAEVNFAGGCIPSSGKVVHRSGVAGAQLSAPELLGSSSSSRASKALTLISPSTGCTFAEPPDLSVPLYLDELWVC
ncbi:Putative ADP-ribosylation factor GTPase-activating protein AGD9 [Durusdinium trenchii]|uniref:ADP-ribosylation factor GTPase-activating protein AGD9 n=1 Tax=Durusdinium trenchii TaxID=1381693 RepID=A0ABP0JVY6_9DINO